jgi:hypothetical protein
LKFSCFILLSLWSNFIFCQENKLPEWIFGNWINSKSTPPIIESWKKLNEFHYFGVSYSVINGDSVVHEKMAIINRNDSIFFTTLVLNQNQGRKIEFLMTNQNLNSITFENKKHDFPTKIEYKKTNNDSIVGIISGIKKGSLKQIAFPMKKKN